MFDGFDDMNSLFATEEDALLEQAAQLANGNALDFKVDHKFIIQNFSKNAGPFESIEYTAEAYKFKITATKNKGSIPFLDLKVVLTNPPSAPQKLAITLTLENKDSSKNITATQTTSLSRNFATVFFTNFTSLNSIMENDGFLTDDTLTIQAIFASSTDTSSLFGAESREVTGYVGLMNQGATCYMNSMLQMLFHLPSFRQLIYDMPTADVENPDLSIPLQLQRLFYNLQFSQTAVSTKDLTKSFGWKTSDIMVQHDVHDFNKVLMATLERKLKGTDLEKGIESIFRGKQASVVTCVNIDYESRNVSEFTELQLHVQGNANLLEAFDQYLEKDRLEGSNQYNVEGHGKQDADIGMELVEMPAVLQLHLNRFTYDYMRDAIVKVNDYFEYPEEVDLGPYVGDGSNQIMYDLVGVLVHSGTNYAGHYYAYIRPEPSADWLEFNDSVVRKAKHEEVFEANFGVKEVEDEDEEDSTPKSGPKRKNKGFVKRNQRMKQSKSFGKKKRGGAVRRRIVIEHSAYLLVYARRDAEEAIYHPSNAALPTHLHEYFAKLAEEAEQRRQMLLQQVYTADVEYVTENQLSLSDTVGFSVSEGNKQKVTVSLQSPISSVVSQLKGICGDDVIVWQCGAYGNPTRILEPDSSATAGQTISKYSVLFIQKGLPPEEGEMMIFVKWFDPKKGDDEKVKYIGCKGFKRSATIGDIASFANCGVPNVKAFVEDFGGKARPVGLDQDLINARLMNGGLVVLQEATEPSEDDFDTSDYAMYLTMKWHAVTVSVSSTDGTQKCEIRAPLLCPFSKFKLALASKAGIDYDPSKDCIILFEAAKESGEMKPVPINTSRRPNLEHVLAAWKGEKTAPLFFELRKGISEEERLQTLYLRVQIADGINIENEHIRLVPVDTPVRSVFEMEAKDGNVDDDIDSYRMFTVWGSSIWELLKPEWKLNDESVFLRIEPTEEVEDGEFLLPAAHDCADDEDRSKFPPLYVRVSSGQTADELRRAIGELYGVDGSKWRLEVSYTTAGKEKRIQLKPTDVLDEYAKQKNATLDVLHTAARHAGRNHVPIKILN